MPGLRLEPFSDAHLDDAAELLAARHRAHREAEPLLPEIGDFEPLVTEARNAADAAGWVAIAGGEVVGYLIGSPRDPVWGEGNVWVELAGHAVREPEIVRDLYAAAAADWVERGWRQHYAIVPAGDRALVDAWFRLGFGAQQAFGIREVPEHTPADTIHVRRAGAADAELAARLDFVLPDHQEVSPVFSQAPRESEDELIADYRDSLAGSAEAVFLAEADGQTLGSIVFAPIEASGMHSGLARPPRACVLGFAATTPEARGRGAGVALTNAGFRWARDEGYDTVVVDWRETNLLASRFWPARGFRRTFQRLFRAIP